MCHPLWAPDPSWSPQLPGPPQGPMQLPGPLPTPTLHAPSPSLVGHLDAAFLCFQRGCWTRWGGGTAFARMAGLGQHLWDERQQEGFRAQLGPCPRWA